MQALTKTACVALGYAAALGLGCAAVAAQRAVMDPAAHSDGMQAFGELLLFAGVFCTASLLPTGMALYWLRHQLGVWSAIGVLGLLLALSGAAGVVLMVVGGNAAPHSGLALLGSLSVLRLMGSPLCVAALGLAAVLARFPGPRKLLLVGTALELAVSVAAGALLFLPMVLQRA